MSKMASEAYKVEWHIRVITAAGTPEAIEEGVAVHGQNYVIRSMYIKALDSNTGQVYLGERQFIDTATPNNCLILQPGEGVLFNTEDYDWQHGRHFNLSNMVFDCDVTGEGIHVTFVRE